MLSRLVCDARILSAHAHLRRRQFKENDYLLFTIKHLESISKNQFDTKVRMHTNKLLDASTNKDLQYSKSSHSDCTTPDIDYRVSNLASYLWK